MFEDKSYEAHEDHKNLFVALQKSLERDYSNQLLADLEEARRKKRKKCATPRSPSRSSLSQQPPPPPLAGASGAPGTSRASGPSQLPPPPPPSSIAWTTFDTRYESVGVSRAQELYPTDSMMHDDSIPDEQVHLSADEDSENDHLPKADLRKDWWKPLPAKERPATPELAWTILSSNMSDVENNWAFALVSTYETPTENSLLVKTRDMTTFMNCSRWRSVTRCSQIRLTGRIRKEIKSESMSTDHYLSVVLQAARYPDFGLELLVPEQMWIDDVCTYDISAKYGISHWSSRSSSWFRQTDAIYCCQAMDPKLRWDAKGYEFKHDYTIIESPRAVVFPNVGTYSGSTGLLSQGIQGQAAQSRYEYAVLDSKGRDKEQRVHSGH
ncbi:hypothetical protein Tco_1164959 [Tanacetum coccineum]